MGVSLSDLVPKNTTLTYRRRRRRAAAGKLYIFCGSVSLTKIVTDVRG